MCKADKGGAILIVPPSLIEEKVQEKVGDENLYTKLLKDPSLGLFDELFDTWKRGREVGFVTVDQAYDIVGVTKPDPTTGHPGGNKSTSSRYRPGTPYFYPMLKIHKLTPDQLKPGVKPPARLVTALNEGVCKRSDVFLADQFLKNVEKQYCGDLLKDTSGALNWLESLNERYTSGVKKIFKCFTFDFASLYDSLNPSLVLKALRHALHQTHPDWDVSKVDWICDLVELSMRSSVGCCKGQWYRQKNGIATGGSLCVELANITVFYVLHEVIYSTDDMMKGVEALKRFVDDCTGAFVGSEREFRLWEKAVRDRLLEFGLKTDDFVLKKPGEPLPFLDIQFWFDTEGNLQTDLYRKPTDSLSFLNFSSHHPNHIFSSVVYSQSIRYRRIINCDLRLVKRIEELKDALLDCGYPLTMVTNITTKVQSFVRNITPKAPTPPIIDPLPIRVVSTYGANDFLEPTLKRYERHLRDSYSFCGMTPSDKMFEYVYRTAPKLGGLLSSTKELMIGNGPGPTRPCGSRRCESCALVTNTETVSHKGDDIQSKHGSCASRNIIYFAVCLLCAKGYTGKTTTCLRSRINGHRALYRKVLRNPEVVNDNKFNNDLSLGYHLHKDHQCEGSDDFNKFFRFTIIHHCGSGNLDVTEHKWIHRLKTLEPGGINVVNPFGIPLIQ